MSDERRSSYYERLGVHRASKPEEIRLAWKKFSRLYHPDAYATKSAKLRANAEQHFIALSEAWSVLRDPKLRADYDARCKVYGDICGTCTGSGCQRVRVKAQSVLVAAKLTACPDCNGTGVVNRSDKRVPETGGGRS